MFRIYPSSCYKIQFFKSKVCVYQCDCVNYLLTLFTHEGGSSSTLSFAGVTA